MMDYISENEGVFNEGAGWYDFHSVQGICPAGWHIPSWDEWETLFSFVGKAEGGIKLKANSPLWEGDTIGTDEFGFSVLPGGALFSFNKPSLGYYNKGEDALIWKATIHPSYTVSQIFWLDENKPETDWANLPREEAAAVRCIKDP